MTTASTHVFGSPPVCSVKSTMALVALSSATFLMAREENFPCLATCMTKYMSNTSCRKRVAGERGVGGGGSRGREEGMVR